MMIAQVIENGTVTNVIVLEEGAIETAEGVVWNGGQLLNTPTKKIRIIDGVGIGWTEDNGDFFPPSQDQ